jgi:L-alanine-DL-glutamate epimerase-like enolase superfamily enzyme
MRTVSIWAAECRIPLPRPISLGPVKIVTRDFVALRILADNELQGDALGYTRGTALLQTLQLIGRGFLGISPHQRKSMVESFLRSSVNGRPTFIRAISLLEIALADLAAKALEQPLFRLFGGDRTRIPALAVAGYYLNDRSHDDVRDEVARLGDEGFARTKIMIGGGDPASDTALVSLVSKVAGGGLGVDAHWSWDSIPEALETCRRIDDEGLLFIEDPFGAHRSRLVGRLQRSIKTPLACGEDVPDIDTLFAITTEVPILRVDATTCGGVSAAAALIQAAGLNGCEVFPHVHFPLHAQLAAAHQEIKFLEVIPERTGADPAHLLLRRLPTVVDGVVHIDEEPGAGFALDWEAVERYAVSKVRLDLEE